MAVHASPEIAARDVVQVHRPRPRVLNTSCEAVAGHDRAGLPINPDVGFISHAPRSQRDMLTTIVLSLIVLTCAVGIAVADKLLR